jgi:hypothetical protein
VRASIVLNETTDATGIFLNFSVALWVPVPALVQNPNANFVSAVPLASAAPAGTTWAIAGITAAELASLQSGAFREVIASYAIPKLLFTDAGSAAVLSAQWTYWQAQVAGTVPPSTADYIGAYGNTTTIAAGSNGASLPQATINVVSTSGASSSGAAFVLTAAGMQMVLYTGITATTLTGCTQGTGAMATGGAVWFFAAA